MTDQAQGLADAGYVTFNADYRLLQTDNSNRWPAQLDDAQLLVRWVRANADRYHVDPNRICALGYSFGGQLAELLGERDTPTDSDLPLASYSSSVACVVALAGISDATQPYDDTTLQSALVRLMGGTVNEVPERYQDASPITQIGTHTAPFLIFQGTSDQFIPVKETMRMVDALQDAGIEVVYVEIPLADHYYWSDWNVEKLETLAFLERHLHPAS